MKQLSPRHTARRGLTLLEIVIALTIFFGALAALSQLAWNGSRAAVQARLKTQAIVRCEAKLAEVLAGIEPMQPKSKVPFPDDSKWTWSLNVTESNYPELLQIEVTAAHSGNNSLANVAFTLNRWMRDPGMFMDAAIQQKSEQEASSSGGTSQ
jgi:general secretion pathway protein I